MPDAHQSQKKQKYQIALLKFIASNRDTQFEKHGDEVNLVGSENKSRKTSIDLINEWLNRDILECKASHDQIGPTIKITPTGKAFLRRLICETDTFAAQHREIEVRQFSNEQGDKIRAMVNVCESPLGWLRKRKDKNGASLIDDAQFMAGERLRADHDRAQLQQRISANWEAALSGGKRGAARGGQDISDSTIDARRRVERALDRVGTELAGVVLDVCCHLKGLGDVENERKWPRRSAKIVLAIALNQLADHYGLSSNATERARVQKTRHWGDGNYRPQINAS